MRTTNVYTLKQFVNDNTKHRDLTHRAMEALEPLFARKQHGLHPTARAEELNPDEVAKAISQSLGTKVTKVLFVSASCPFPKPEWMSDSLYREIAKDAIGHDARLDFGELWGKILDHFENDARGLRSGIRETITNECFCCRHYPLSLEFTLENTAGNSIFHFLGAACAGEEKVVKRLMPLITLLPKAVPLCEKRDEPGVWLVLTA